jgi:hypothetical protein
MKLGILTALWGRKELTYLYLNRMQRLQDKYGVMVGCVGSQNQFRESCLSREILYTDCENRPLGTKWNHGLQLFETTDVSHVMILGSDDFASDRFFEYAMDYAEKKNKDFCGCYDLWIYGGNPSRRGFGVLWYFRYRGFLVGPGRIYSRKALQFANWKLWHPSKNSGLDGSAAKTMRLLGDKIERGHWISKDEDLFIVDIKTAGGNISSIPGAAKQTADDIEYMLKKHLPEDAENLLEFIDEQENNNSGSRVIRSYDST